MSRVRNVKTNEVTEEAAGGVFIYVGLDPLTEPFRASGLTNETGWIPTNEMMETTMPGVYAVGMFEKKRLTTNHYSSRGRQYRWPTSI